MPTLRHSGEDDQTRRVILTGRVTPAATVIRTARGIHAAGPGPLNIPAVTGQAGEDR